MDGKIAPVGQVEIVRSRRGRICTNRSVGPQHEEWAEILGAYRTSENVFPPDNRTNLIVPLGRLRVPSALPRKSYTAMLRAKSWLKRAAGLAAETEA